jgi:hypothetical protein
MTELLKNRIEEKDRWLCNYIEPNFLDKKVNKSKLGLNIAIQISGGLRHFKFVIPWVNHFLVEPLDADVFVHGWSNNFGIEENENSLNRYKNLKLFKVNDINDPKFNFLKKDIKNIEKVYGNLYNVFECNKIRVQYETNNNFNYDIVIKIRPDAFFFDTISDDILLKLMSGEEIGIPQDYFGNLWCSLTTDMFAIGRSDVINNYTLAYKFIEDSIKYQGVGPEDSIHYHLMNNMKNIKILNTRVNFVIDYLPFLPKEEMDMYNTRFNMGGSEWSF